MLKSTHKGTNTTDLVYFEDIFNECYPALLAYGYRFISNKQVVEDIVQNIFMSLWIKKKELDFSNSIKPYLYTAVRNNSLSYLSTHQMTCPFDGDETDMLILQITSVYNQFDSLLLKEITGEIEACINTLPPQCQRIFRLSRGENKKNREIAELLEITEKAVEKQISKALLILRLHLQKMDLLSALYWTIVLQILSNRF